MHETKKILKRGLYIGTFDPLTKGHEDIVNQALNIFDEVIIVVSNNPIKSKPFFCFEERLEMVHSVFKSNPRVRVSYCEKGHDIIYVSKIFETSTIIRGIRNTLDTDYESQINQFYKELSDGVFNTVYFFASNELRNVSSTMVKQLMMYCKDVHKYINDEIYDTVARRIIDMRGEGFTHEEEVKKET